MPKLLVRVLVQVAHPAWGSELDPRTPLERTHPNVQVMEKAVARCKPRLVWSNADFAISVPTVNQ